MVRAVPIQPQENRVRLGDRLRAVRRAQGLTIDEVAEFSGLSKGFVSRVERDETSPSVASLVSLCQVLSLPVGELFSAPEVAMVPGSDAPRVNLGGVETSDKLLTPRGQSMLQIVRSEIGPGGHGGEELYTLNCDVEILHVITGALELIFADRVEEVRAGDTATFRGRDPHSWRNLSATKPASALWVIAPAAWRAGV